MKPSIFIGSSSEALSLAKAIKRELSGDYQAEIWSERLFELGEDTLNNLFRFVACLEGVGLGKFMAQESFDNSALAEKSKPALS